MRNQKLRLLTLFASASLVGACSGTDEDSWLAVDRSVQALDGEQPTGGIPAPFAPTFDTYTRGGNFAATAYGDASELMVKHSTNANYSRQAYFKFSFADLEQSVERARFRFYITGEGDSRPRTLQLYKLNSDTLDEGTTWDDVSSISSLFRSEIEISGEGWYQFDVTSDVNWQIENTTTNEVVFRLAMKSSSTDPAKNWIRIGSLEHEAHRPHLVGGDSSIDDYYQYFDFMRIPAWKAHPSKDDEDCPDVSSWPQSSGHFRTLIASSRFGDAFPKNEYNSTYFADANNRVGTGTGFFTVGRIGSNNRYTFLDPSGFQFYSIGVNSVNPYRNGNADDGTSIDATAEAFRDHFGEPGDPAAEAEWGAQTTKLFREHHINTLGSWSVDDLESSGMSSEPAAGTGAAPLVRTPQLSLLGAYSNIAYSCSQGTCRPQREYLDEIAMQVEGHPDRRAGEKDEISLGSLRLALLYREYPATSSKFENWVAGRVASKLTDDVVNDSRILGFFTDNELAMTLDLLDAFLRMDADTGPYQFAEDFLRAEIEDPNARYGVKRNLQRHLEGGENTNRVRRLFLKRIVEDYFRIVTNAIRAVDANHLILGSRFHKHSGALSKESYASQRLDVPEFLQAAGAYVDVLSINLYHEWTPDQGLMNAWEEHSGRPFLISEFYVKNRKDIIPGYGPMPNCGGAGWLVSADWERGRFYQNYMMAVLRNSNSVGVHWFNYMDGDPRTNGRENASNKGLLGIDFSKNTGLLGNMKTVNESVYRLRWRLQNYCESELLLCD